MNKVIGIDISKETFDVGFHNQQTWIHQNFANNTSGFNAFVKTLTTGDRCVMEASGPYYLRLAIFLYKHGIQVSVVNPLVIKRFVQMRLVRTKTDKKDAQMIAEYGMIEDPNAWQPEEKQIAQLRQMFTLLQGIDKQIQMLSAQLHAFHTSGVLNSLVSDTINTLLKTLKSKKEKISREMAVLALQSYEQTISRLQTIPGIGQKTAILLTVITNDFNRFERSRQLTAYVGFSPRIYQSGKSVRGKGHICKMGNSMVRKYLYMCTWTAKVNNKACKTMYERLKERGKPERVIKVAIANKLLKQAFGLIKNQSDYNENYIPKPCF